ncbi:MAG: YadA-like family protein [bacterium]
MTKKTILSLLLLVLLYPSTILKADLTVTENSQQQIIASNGTHTWTINKGVAEFVDDFNIPLDDVIKIENNRILFGDDPYSEQSIGDITMSNEINLRTLEQVLLTITPNIELKFHVDGDFTISIQNNTTSEIYDTSFTPRSAVVNNNTITSSKVQNGSLQNEDFQDNSISSSKIQNGSLQNEDFQDNSITSSKIQNGSLQNEDFQDNSIDITKLAPSLRSEFSTLSKRMAMQAAEQMATQDMGSKDLTVNIGYGSFLQDTAIAVGINYKANKKLNLNSAITSDLDQQTNMSIGITHQINKKLALTSSISSDFDTQNIANAGVSIAF